jgi:hypothetical protein
MGQSLCSGVAASRLVGCFRRGAPGRGDGNAGTAAARGGGARRVGYFGHTDQAWRDWNAAIAAGRGGGARLVGVAVLFG